MSSKKEGAGRRVARREAGKVFPLFLIKLSAVLQSGTGAGGSCRGPGEGMMDSRL